MSLSNASIVRLSNSLPLKAVRQAITCGKIIDRAVAIQQIPSPTFEEQKRAASVMQQFQKLGLEQVEQDDLHNVYGWLPGSHEEVLLISAHTDTVFPAETSLEIRRENGRIYGPGLGDNSLGVAGLITLAELFLQSDVPHDATLCFVANTREEGLGNLEGINHVASRLSGRIRAGIVVEGMALGRIYHAGIAVRRLKVMVTAPGGHSWLHFGSESAVHRLMRFGADLSYLSVPEKPRTTFNIGLISGGSSINTIAGSAECYLDLRSEDMETLNELESRVRSLAERNTTSGVTFDFEAVGERPAGGIPQDHPLIRLAVDAHREINMTVELESGSTDANALLSRGIPTVCVGISYGGNAHTPGEYIETAPVEDGMWQLFLLTAAASNAVTVWE
ncbi:MAG TPA: M20/M25/M40 family metallo-hydrolase [Aggregatilineales bacterium]|nr:M20/M25/M40 family metallo-hydrolase [Aggregatilineales bacterium]